MIKSKCHSKATGLSIVYLCIRCLCTLTKTHYPQEWRARRRMLKTISTFSFVTLKKKSDKTRSASRNKRTREKRTKGYPKMRAHALTNAVESLRKVIRHQKYVICVRDYLLRRATTERIQCFIRVLYNPRRGGDVLLACANKQARSYSMSIHYPYGTRAPRDHRRQPCVHATHSSPVKVTHKHLPSVVFWNKATPHASSVHIWMNNSPKLGNKPAGTGLHIWCAPLLFR